MGCNRRKHNTPNTLTSSIKKNCSFQQKAVLGEGDSYLFEWGGSDSKKLMKDINLIWIIIMFRVDYLSFLVSLILNISPFLEKSGRGGDKMVFSYLWSEAKILTIEPKFQVSKKKTNHEMRTTLTRQQAVDPAIGLSFSVIITSYCSYSF